MESPCASAAHPRPVWQEEFVTLLPAIQSQARVAFRRMNTADREEAVHAVVALAAIAYARLVERGRADCGFAAPLTKFAVRQYRAGRLAGGRVNRFDVGSRSCQQRGCVVVALDQWEQAICDSRRADPAEVAALRIDLGEWLSRLTPRNRRLAGELARGERTDRVAEKFQLSTGRVSQLRRELAESWQRFVGDAPVTA